MRPCSSLALALLVVSLSAASCLAAEGRDHYEVLGIEKSAGQPEIKKAYRKMALKWHPDRNPLKQKFAEKRFREVAEAYDVLSDIEKKANYDEFGDADPRQQQQQQQRQQQGRGQGGGAGFGGGFGQQHGGGRHPQRGGGANINFGGGSGGGMPNFGGGGGGGGGNPFGDMFSQMFGGGGGGQRGPAKSAGPPPGGNRDPRSKRPGGRGGADTGAGAGSGAGGAGMYEGDTNVQLLTPKSFPGDRDASLWIVEFFAPWCGHCKKLAPQWKAAAKSLKGLGHVGAVDCDAHATLCTQHGAAGYPHIAAKVPGSTGLKVYAGEKTAAAISEWALSLLPSQVKALRTQAHLDALLARCGPNAASKAAERATWSVCAVLITGDRAEPPAAVRALSLELKGKVAMGELRGAGPQGTDAARALAATLLPDGGGIQLPALVMVCFGDLRLAELYTGDLKPGPLAAHAAAFEAGRRCAGALRLTGVDLEGLSAGQLQQVIKDRKLSCKGCTERDALLQTVQKYVAGGGV